MSSKILDDMCDVMRLHQYSIQHTERTYCNWIKRYMQYHIMTRREEELVNDETKIEMFLTHLAFEKEAPLPTQN